MSYPPPMGFMPPPPSATGADMYAQGSAYPIPGQAPPAGSGGYYGNSSTYDPPPSAPFNYAAPQGMRRVTFMTETYTSEVRDDAYGHVRFYHSLPTMILSQQHPNPRTITLHTLQATQTVQTRPRPLRATLAVCHPTCMALHQHNRRCRSSNNTTPAITCSMTSAASLWYMTEAWVHGCWWALLQLPPGMPSTTW